jgi:hypothetical protein
VPASANLAGNAHVRHDGKATFGQIRALSVMAGLDPAIHLVRKILFESLMDARVKPAHDNVSRAPKN